MNIFDFKRIRKDLYKIYNKLNKNLKKEKEVGTSVHVFGRCYY